MMPKQKPGKSKQDYETPPDFIAAVERRFGKLEFDLAATKANAKAAKFYTPEQDSLIQSWPSGLLWLNPPFNHIAPWAKRCAERKGGARILLLTPASVGANWFRDYVFGKALVLFLNKRLTFVGETTVYPKDCILSVYGERPGFEIWDWQ